MDDLLKEHGSDEFARTFLASKNIRIDPSILQALENPHA
jgi:hypothetical protein